jgi:hypothetical protein
VPSPEDQSPAELRTRALHVRLLAENFEQDEIWERLQAFAAELDVRTLSKLPQRLMMSDAVTA